MRTGRGRLCSSFGRCRCHLRADVRGVFRLKALAKATPDALGQVLRHFEARNVVPCCMLVQRMAIPGSSAEALEIEIQVPAAEIGPENFRFISAQVAGLPIVITGVVGD